MIDQLWALTDYTLNTLYNKNVPVIWGYQNAARIKKPYVMLNYTTDDLPDHEIIDKFVDLNGMRVISSWRKAVVDMQFYDAHNSISLASFMASAFATDKSLDKQMELNCSIGTRLFLQRVPALINESQYEDRAIYQFDFYYTEMMKEDVGFIATVIVDGTYEGSLTDNLTCNEVISFPYPAQNPAVPPGES